MKQDVKMNKYGYRSCYAPCCNLVAKEMLKDSAVSQARQRSRSKASAWQIDFVAGACALVQAPATLMWVRHMLRPELGQLREMFRSLDQAEGEYLSNAPISSPIAAKQEQWRREIDLFRRYVSPLLTRRGQALIALCTVGRRLR